MLLIRVDETEVLVRPNYAAHKDYPEFGLKEGDDFRIFYYNNREFHTFERLNYYDKPYSFEEKYSVMIKKNLNLDKWIKEFDLIPNE